VGAPDPLTTQIAQGTQVVTAAANLSKAIIDGKQAMSLADKMKLLAERADTTLVTVGGRVDALLTRYDALDARSQATFSALDKQLAPHESAMDDLEAAQKLMDKALAGNTGT